MKEEKKEPERKAVLVEYVSYSYLKSEAGETFMIRKPDGSYPFPVTPRDLCSVGDLVILQKNKKSNSWRIVQS